MEMIQTSISEILNIISTNFWQLFIIIALIKTDNLKIFGIVLLFTQLLLGYEPWIYIVTLLCIGINSMSNK